MACAQLRILLAEDNPANQKLATYVLQDRGHLVEIAGDGREAIRLTERNRYDVILMDVQMPGMDGLEATAAIRKREDGGSRVPIIAMTAHAMKGDREQCLAAGMDGYLSKPIDAHEMIALVESLAAAAAAASTGAASPPEPTSPPAAVVFDPELALKRCLNKRDLLQEMIRSSLRMRTTSSRKYVPPWRRATWRRSGGWGTGSKGLSPTLAQRRQEKPRCEWNASCCMPVNRRKPSKLCVRWSGSAKS